jgi:homoserine trans-succinylase
MESLAGFGMCLFGIVVIAFQRTVGSCPAAVAAEGRLLKFLAMSGLEVRADLVAKATERAKATVAEAM